MATDYGYKNAAAKPMYVGTKNDNDMPLDARTRIDTITDIDQITFPFVGMIFYVVDEDAYYSVKTLKGEESRPGNPNTFVPNYKIDTYEPFTGGASPKETVIEACDPSDPDAKTVVADDADPFDEATQIKVSDANAKAPEGVTFSPGDTVKEVIKSAVDLSEIEARLDALEKATGIDKPSYKPSTDGTGLEVVADDADPFDPNTQIKISDANKDGGNFNIGDKVQVEPKPSLEDRLAALEEKINEVNPDPLPITFDAYLGTVNTSGTESLTKYTINKPGAGKAYEFPVNMTSAAKVVIEYPQTIGELVSISDTNTGMELIDGFTKTTTTKASIAHYRYTLNNAVVLKDTFLFYWSK